MYSTTYMKKIPASPPPCIYYCEVVIAVGLQVGILNGILEGEIKCPVYIVVMMVALLCSDGTNPAFVCKPVVVDNGRRLRRRRWDGVGGTNRRR